MPGCQLGDMGSIPIYRSSLRDISHKSEKICVIYLVFFVMVVYYALGGVVEGFHESLISFRPTFNS